MMYDLKLLLVSTITLFLGGGAGWFWQKKLTPREKQAIDYQTVTSSLQPLLDSIKNLTEQNVSLIDAKIKLEDKNMQLLRENRDLKDRVITLEKRMKALEGKLNKLIKSKHDTDK